mgnify:CR=1 FL=1
MSWLYSRALVEEYLGDICLDGEQSAPLSGNLIPQAYCAPDKMTVFSRLSRFGMTYKPLTENLGEELLTSFREAFLAKIFQSLGGGLALTENDLECGVTWPGWLAKYDPDTSLWRTAQCSLLEDLNECLATLPRWGMTRNGLLWAQPMLEPITKGTEFGLLQEIWPTPRCQMTRPVAIRQDIEKGHRGNLEEVVAVREKWPTPTAHMAKETNAPSEALRNEPTLTSRVGGKLNPMWVEWLMGWPLGWTDLKPLETDKSHCVPQQLGDC